MLHNSHVLLERVGALQDLVVLLDLLCEGSSFTSMTARLFELERITPMRVTTPVMHATMIDSIKELPPEIAFRPQEAVSNPVTSSSGRAAGTMEP